MAKTMAEFTITKVVSKSFLMDWVASFQNWFGLNLTTYEDMVKKGLSQIEDDLREQGIVPKWRRYEMTQLTNGAIAIICYGEAG